jgi:hypothetical protein
MSDEEQIKGFIDRRLRQPSLLKQHAALLSSICGKTICNNQVIFCSPR